ncbi:Skb1 methyltransferase [Hypoxylon sp. NC1633]|nr:Skb1 methyltransferase [Hypoxylon sp. NC1633]
MSDFGDQESIGYDDVRPTFYIGQHDSGRLDTLTDLQYGQVLNAGFSYVTTPITNRHFRERVTQLAFDFVNVTGSMLIGTDPIVQPLTTDDTTLFPGSFTSGLVAWSSPWIDLCSHNLIISSISRQVLNLEVSYASFCGIRTIIVPGPIQDSVRAGSGHGIAQYARAIQEALSISTRVNIVIEVPMYRELGLEKKASSWSLFFDMNRGKMAAAKHEIDPFSSWDSWHIIRSVCGYNSRLLVALEIPHNLPDSDLQARWFSEPIQYLTFGPQTFQTNKAGYPSLTPAHQDLILTYMRLKNTPYILLCDVGPEVKPDPDSTQLASDTSSALDFPTPEEAASQLTSDNSLDKVQGLNVHSAYLRHLERSQDPLSDLELATLTNYQDWLQSPLQPLSDNLESTTYEVFEADPVKYFQYEKAIAAALRDWAAQGKPTSSPGGEVVIVVAGSGRGPLVTRALRASESTGVPVRVWALEKNPNAYVYLLRQNQVEWGGRVTVIKADMRAWKGPVLVPGGTGPSGKNKNIKPQYGKVDILVSELLGSFGDNELSPECLDGIQHVLAPTYGISIPASYTAHVTPIATPRLHADIRQRAAPAPGGGGGDPSAFETPWVVRLFAIDFLAARGVPDHPRFQTTWEFAHPISTASMAAIEARRSGGVAGGGGGSMARSVGLNDHNARHCHLTFVCRTRGVVHGIAGYFEAVLYTPEGKRNSGEDEKEESEEEKTENEGEKTESEGETEEGEEEKEESVEEKTENEGEKTDSEGETEEGEEENEKIELSTLPDMMDRKNKDMMSWFPIFFPLKEPLYFADDTELEVSMWRQTDDTRVWYEWMIEAFTWISPSLKIKIGASKLCSSRNVACTL